MQESYTSTRAYDSLQSHRGHGYTWRARQALDRGAQDSFCSEMKPTPAPTTGARGCDSGSPASIDLVAEIDVAVDRAGETGEKKPKPEAATMQFVSETGTFSPAQPLVGRTHSNSSETHRAGNLMSATLYRTRSAGKGFKKLGASEAVSWIVYFIALGIALAVNVPLFVLRSVLFHLSPFPFHSFPRLRAVCPLSSTIAISAPFTLPPLLAVLQLCTVSLSSPAVVCVPVVDGEWVVGARGSIYGCGCVGSVRVRDSRGGISGGL